MIFDFKGTVEWKRFEDEKPPKEVLVLVYTPITEYMGRYDTRYYVECKNNPIMTGWHVDGEEGDCIDKTGSYWSYLPEPPEREE